ARQLPVRVAGSRCFRIVRLETGRYQPCPTIIGDAFPHGRTIGHISRPKFLFTRSKSFAGSMACPLCVISPCPCMPSKALMTQGVSARYMNTVKRHEIDNPLFVHVFAIVANKNSGLNLQRDALAAADAKRS